MSSEGSSMLSEFESDADLALLGGDFDEVDATTATTTTDSEAGGDANSDAGKGADETTTVATGDQKPEPGKEGTATEAAGGEETDKKDTHDDRDQAIPRARFNEVNRQLKEEREAREALEARLQSLERGENKPPPGDNKGESGKGQGEHEPTSDQVIIDLERQYQEAILTEDDDKAIELRAKINAETRRQAREEALQVIEARESERSKRDQAKQAQELLDKAAEEMVQAYPVLDLNSSTGDKAKVEEVVEWRNFLIAQKGYAPHDALREASRRVLGDPVGGDSKLPPKDERVAGAVKRGLKESEQQPPTGEAGVGVRAAGVGAKTPESQDEYERLPKSEQNKLLQ